MYLESSPGFEVWKKFAGGMPLRELQCQQRGRIEGAGVRYDGPIYYLTEKAHPNETDNGIEITWEDDIEITTAEWKKGKEGDTFDEELDEEVVVVAKQNEQERIARMMEVARENEEMIKQKMTEQGLQESDLNSGRPRYKDKKPMRLKKERDDKSRKGRYATHGIKFAERRDGGYVEMKSDSEASEISECDSNESKSLINETESGESDDEVNQGGENEESRRKFEKLNVEIRKSLRFVHFNEKDMTKGLLFPGLVFSSKEQLKEALTAFNKQYVVDVYKRMCSCGSWQLSGIPCPHSIPCLIATNRSPLDTVEKCYSVETFLRTYTCVLQPIEGMSQWPRDYVVPLQMPKVVKQPGRPKKSRKRDVNEVKRVGKTDKLTRWHQSHCGWCGETDHNQRRCKKKADGVPQVKRKGKGKRIQVDDGTVDDVTAPVVDAEMRHVQEDHGTQVEPDLTQVGIQEPVQDVQVPQNAVNYEPDIEITGVHRDPTFNSQNFEREQRQANRYKAKRAAKLKDAGTSKGSGRNLRSRKK